MSDLPLIGEAVTAGLLARQIFVLSATVRSCRFLRGAGLVPPAPSAARPHAGNAPVFFIVLPVLREAAILAQAAAHFSTVAEGHRAQIAVVTTAREAAEAQRHEPGEDTVTLASGLAAQGTLVHLHYPDPLGLKADQLNHAVACCAMHLPAGVPPGRAFAVCYDADSRPPRDSLARFEQAIAANPGAGIFHQSSRFELRAAPDQRGWRSWLGRAVCDGGALRANRFVVGFEIPRLRSRPGPARSLRRRARSYVYAHVTGHGLCARLSLLQRLPFPARSPLEDMHYSFILGSRGLPMVAVPSLDVAEVPGTVRGQVQQAARWFFGPARCLRYLKDPATERGWRARMLAASAAGSSAEWLGCAVVPAFALALLAAASGVLRALAAAFVAVCAAQLAVTEAFLGSPGPLRCRVIRVLAFPAACTLHGIGGVLGMVRLLRGGSGAGKTERPGPG